MTSSLIKTPPKLKVINLWAGPGAGKSTTASHLFTLMKDAEHRVELVTEVAKDLTYDGDLRRLDAQIVSMAKQYDRLHRLEGQVEYAITDSPLPLGAVYASPRWRTETYFAFLREAYNHFDNVDVWVTRTKRYQNYGRRETEEEAKELDRRIRVVFDSYAGKSHYTTAGNATGAPALLKVLKAAKVVS